VRLRLRPHFSRASLAVAPTWSEIVRMIERRVLQLLPTAGMAVACAALGLAWVVEPSLAPGGWAGRLAVLLAGICLALLAVRISLLQSAKSAESARRYIDCLCGLEAHALGDDNVLDAIPLRKGDHVWRDLCQRVRQKLVEFAKRTEDLEMNRAAAEVRVRRTVVERDQLREILAGLNDPVVAVDQFGEIVLANPSAEKLLAVKTNGHEHPALEQLQRCEQLVSMLTETRRRRAVTLRSAEVTLPDDEGKPHWFRITCRSLAQQLEAHGASDRGSQHGAVAVLTDITGQKAIQKRNAEFVSAVSHEMKTPLSSIRAYVELLVDGEADDEPTREEFLGVINSQADRLQRLIDNLLNLARIEAGVVAVNKSPLSLNELLQEALGVMQPAAETKQIALTSEFSPLYLGVLADRDMLLQGAINLISNAVKYTRASGSVVLRSKLNDQEVVFEVQDTGVGLSPEDCQKVFEKFYRVKKDSDLAPGTGLGLALVKHIVEDVHGGRIEVVSQLGQGSTFRVIIPGLGQLNA
jgi:two-component system phosphate regulon sensor histidine kinase PhoR